MTGFVGGPNTLGHAWRHLDEAARPIVLADASGFVYERARFTFRGHVAVRVHNRVNFMLVQFFARPAAEEVARAFAEHWGLRL